jgi:hypothetical protein
VRWHVWLRSAKKPGDHAPATDSAGLRSFLHTMYSACRRRVRARDNGSRGSRALAMTCTDLSARHDGAPAEDLGRQLFCAAAALAGLAARIRPQSAIKDSDPAHRRSSDARSLWNRRGPVFFGGVVVNAYRPRRPRPHPTLSRLYRGERSEPRQVGAAASWGVARQGRGLRRRESELAAWLSARSRWRRGCGWTIAP